MDEETDVETTNEALREGKERNASTSSAAGAEPCTQTNRSKELQHTKDSFPIHATFLAESQQVESKQTSTSKSTSACTDEFSTTETKKSDCNLSLETTLTDSRSKTDECRQSVVQLVANQAEDTDTCSTLRTAAENERKNNNSTRLNSPDDKDSSETINKMGEEKQNGKKEWKMGNVMKTGKGKRKADAMSCDELPDEVKVSSSIESCKNTNANDFKQQKSPEGTDTGQEEARSKSKRRRKDTTRVHVSNIQSTSTVSQESLSKDVDAEWSIEEKKLLLEALESDAGKRFWNPIAKKVKTKNVKQVKHFTEKLRAQANGVTPVHLIAEKDDPLEMWLKICEHLRTGQDDIDAKCIPQVMTIAAVEPSSSNKESTHGPNYARIYTFLSGILRGQTTTILTPIDAKVILELLHSLEMKVMNADIQNQRSFLKDRYGSIMKELEYEQIVLAMNELYKEIIIMGEEKETSKQDTRKDDFDKEERSRSERDQNLAKNIDKKLEGSETLESVSSCSSNIVGVPGSDDTRTDNTITNTPMPGIGNQTFEATKTSELMPLSYAISVDSAETKNDETKNDETNALESVSKDEDQVPTVESEFVENCETKSLSSCDNDDTRGFKRTRKGTIQLPSLDESSKRNKERLRMKLMKLKKELKRPQLSSLNPVSIPVSLLKIKPRSSHR